MRLRRGRNPLQHDSSVEPMEVDIQADQILVTNAQQPSGERDVTSTSQRQSKLALKRKMDETYIQFQEIKSQLEADDEDEEDINRRVSAKLPKFAIPQAFFNRHPSKFSGTEDYVIWWSEINLYLRQFQHIQEAEKVCIKDSCVTGNARMILDAAGLLKSVTQINDILRRVFIIETSSIEAIIQTIQKPDEPVEQFAARLRVAVIKSLANDASIDHKKVDRDCLTFFRLNTRKELRERLSNMFPGSIEIAVQAAKHFEVEESASSSKKHIHKNHSEESFEKQVDNRFKQIHDKINTIKAAPENLNALKVTPATTSEIMEQMNLLLQKQSENIRRDFGNGNNKNQQRNNSYRVNNLKCFHCHKIGHGFDKCYSATEVDKTKIREERQLR